MSEQQPINYREEDEKHVLYLLNKWQGGNVALWEYGVSHRKLTIRVTSKRFSGNLHIVCVECSHMSGFFGWANCSFKVERLGDDKISYVLRDASNGFELHCGLIGVEENIDPIY